jgi:hypothetical protein
MDSAAFQEIIALARGIAAELSAAEKKVSAFKDELTQLDHPAPTPAVSRPITINTKASGWIPEGKRTALKGKT